MHGMTKSHQNMCCTTKQAFMSCIASTETSFYGMASTGLHLNVVGCGDKLICYQLLSSVLRAEYACISSYNSQYTATKPNHTSSESSTVMLCAALRQVILSHSPFYIFECFKDHMSHYTLVSRCHSKLCEMCTRI